MLLLQDPTATRPEEFNRMLRRDLAAGQNAVFLRLATVSTNEPGIVVDGLPDLEAALADIDLGALPLFLEAGEDAASAVSLLTKLARERGTDPKLLRGSVAWDPLAVLASRGRLRRPLAACHEDLAAACRWSAEEAPGMLVVEACGRPWHEAGGTAVQELALTLASAVEHLRALDERNVPLEVAAPRFLFSFSVDTRFFLEIAKLRAARLLWARVVAACGGDDAAARPRIHVRTSRRNKSRLDRHTNLLRATTESLAAILGGCDSLQVAPYAAEAGDAAEDEIARRRARNIPLILRHESHLDRVADPAGGSWYVENLTAELAAAAWTLFQEIEAAGGLAAALADGMPQRLIATAAEERRQALATRREIRVGVNRYPLADETLSPSPETAPAAIDGDSAQVEALVPFRDAADFESLRGNLSDRCGKDPDRPRIRLVRLGPAAGYTPRLDFARSFFQLGGFALVESADCDSLETAVRAAADGDAPVVVLVGTDETYDEQVSDLAPLLKESPTPPLVILAGAPGGRRDEWQAAGVDRFMHVHTDLPAFLGRLAADLGVRS